MKYSTLRTLIDVERWFNNATSLFSRACCTIAYYLCYLFLFVSISVIVAFIVYQCLTDYIVMCYLFGIIFIALIGVSLIFINNYENERSKMDGDDSLLDMQSTLFSEEELTEMEERLMK